MSAEGEGCGCSSKVPRKYTRRPFGKGKSHFDISVDTYGDDDHENSNGKRGSSKKVEFVHDEYVPEEVVEHVLDSIEKKEGRRIADAYKEKIKDYFSKKPITFDVLSKVEKEKDTVTRKYFLSGAHPYDVEVSDILRTYIRDKTREARRYAKEVPTQMTEVRSGILTYIDWLDAVARG